jgi:hypothetical protein
MTDARASTPSNGKTITGRGHALIIDSGWRDVADKALAFVQRFVKS